MFTMGPCSSSTSLLKSAVASNGPPAAPISCGLMLMVCEMHTCALIWIKDIDNVAQKLPCATAVESKVFHPGQSRSVSCVWGPLNCTGGRVREKAARTEGLRQRKVGASGSRW